jgi:hypothetical protein
MRVSLTPILLKFKQSGLRQRLTKAALSYFYLYLYFYPLPFALTFE